MEPRVRIRAFIVDNFFVDAFEDDASFLATGLVDSLGIAQLVAWVEETFAITIDERELVPDNVDSVAQLAAFIARKQQPTRTAA